MLSGSHHELLGQTLEALRRFGGGDIPVLLGGTIPPPDQKALFDLGARRIFTSDMPLGEVVSSIAEALR